MELLEEYGYITNDKCIVCGDKINNYLQPYYCKKHYLKIILFFYYKEKKLKTFIVKKIENNLRHRLYRYVRSNNSPRHKKLLGCSIEQLKQHLEKQFQSGMSWQNYGKWHVDHIKPCASFDLNNSTEQEVCFHYTNLQPLWAKDNLRKSDNIIYPELQKLGVLK
jgi:hypothetical protein